MDFQSSAKLRSPVRQCLPGARLLHMGLDLSTRTGVGLRFSFIPISIADQLPFVQNLQVIKRVANETQPQGQSVSEQIKTNATGGSGLTFKTRYSRGLFLKNMNSTFARAQPVHDAHTNRTDRTPCPERIILRRPHMSHQNCRRTAIRRIISRSASRCFIYITRNRNTSHTVITEMKKVFCPCDHCSPNVVTHIFFPKTHKN